MLPNNMLNGRGLIFSMQLLKPLSIQAFDLLAANNPKTMSFHITIVFLRERLIENEMKVPP